MTYGGKAYQKSTFNVLICTSHCDRTHWDYPYYRGNTPHHPVIGGYESTQDNYYFIGRIEVGSSMIVGKVHPKTTGFYYSIDNIHEIRTEGRPIEDAYWVYEAFFNSRI